MSRMAKTPLDLQPPTSLFPSTCFGNPALHPSVLDNAATRRGGGRLPARSVRPFLWPRYLAQPVERTDCIQPKGMSSR